MDKGWTDYRGGQGLREYSSPNGSEPAGPYDVEVLFESDGDVPSGCMVIYWVKGGEPTREKVIAEVEAVLGYPVRNVVATWTRHVGPHPLDGQTGG